MEILVIICSAKSSVNRDRLLFLRIIVIVVIIIITIIIIIIIIIITDASIGKTSFGCSCMEARPMVNTMESDSLASFVC